MITIASATMPSRCSDLCTCGGAELRVQAPQTARAYVVFPERLCPRLDRRALTSEGVRVSSGPTGKPLQT
eukprot:4785225-Alexandrium_andersonii.AAC.1